MLRSYLRQYRMPLVFALLLYLICFAVLLLSSLPVTAVLYALGLGCVLGLTMLILGYFPYARRHKLLKELDIRDSLDHLPQPISTIEADYQALLQQLFSDKEAAKAAATERYNDTLDYFTLWAHQIKTPISAMDLILQAGEGNGELKGELFKVQQYVSMALNFLRLGEGISDFVFREYPLDDILRTAIHTYAGQFIRMKVHLDFTPTNATVLTDEKWLEFVIEQLLSNALKYAPGGTVSIYLEGPEQLVIADNGIGIAPEDLPRIFEKGYTGLNGRRTRKTTGIGLYLCHEILTRLGHGISITSQPGQGTQVSLDLHRQEFDIE